MCSNDDSATHTFTFTWKRWSLNWWFYVINSQYIADLMIWRALVFELVLQLHEQQFIINKLMTKSWAGKYSLFKTPSETINHNRLLDMVYN